jgi:hypothetical protein
MTMEHVHEWQPASDLGFGRYRCGCGSTGFRYRGGEITPHKTRLRPDQRAGGRRTYNGAVPARPSLSFYDRARR